MKNWTSMWALCGWTLLLVAALPASATTVRSVRISSDLNLPAPRWMYDSKVRVKGPKIVEQLVAIRKADRDGRFTECETLSRKAGKDAKGLQAWMALTRLTCATSAVKADPSNSPGLLEALNYVGDHPQWMVFGPQVESLRKAYTEALVVGLASQLKRSRKRAWSLFDQSQVVLRWMTSEQKAQLFRSSGELAFIEQNLNLAVDLYGRSLDEQESSDVRKRLESLRGIISGKAAEKAQESPVNKFVSDASSEEQPIVARMKQAIDSGDLMSAVEDGIQIIHKYPGSTAAKWSSDRILEIYLNIGGRSEKSYVGLRVKAVELMFKADGGRLYRWALNASAKGFYQDAAQMAVASFEKMEPLADSTKILVLASQSLLYLGQYGDAEKYYLRLVNEHAGTEESRLAMFRLGLIKYRTKKWGDASAYFERLIALPNIGDWEYLSLYWLWRSLQQSNAAGAGKIAERLMLRFPLTYYGLRARGELNGGVLTFPQASGSPIKSDVWMTETQSQSWERFQILLKAGWFDEAQAELSTLPDPQSPEDKIVRAHLLVSAFNDYMAIRTFNDAWTQKPELMQWNIVKQAFPLEFSSTIELESRNTSLDPSLVRGLIRQESSFRPKVISSANAYGVMQILPLTAQDVAAKWTPALDLPGDLLKPEINIRVGVTYLGRLVRTFKGHVPLALAAYNAGIGRLRKWQGARTEIGELEGRLSSAPEHEVWIDELPWDETRLYVKAVLRNNLIYQLMNKNELKLVDPLWKAEKL